MPSVARCPNCTTELDVGDDVRRGEAVECPICLTRFVPDRPPPPPPPPAEERPADQDRDAGDDKNPDRPRRSRRRGDGGDEDGDEDDRPRRRRRRRYADDPLTREEAEDIVRGPATALQITGWAGAALNLLGGAGFAALGVVQLQNGPQNAQAQEDAVAMIVVAAMFALFGTLYFAAIGFGAGKIKRIESWGWGMTAAVLGILTVALCGLCFPTTWAGIACGIWAIVAMNKPGVKAAFPQADDEE